jgi:hypothetical protein
MRNLLCVLLISTACASIDRPRDIQLAVYAVQINRNLAIAVDNIIPLVESGAITTDQGIDAAELIRLASVETVRLVDVLETLNELDSASRLDQLVYAQEIVGDITKLFSTAIGIISDIKEFREARDSLSTLSVELSR